MSGAHAESLIARTGCDCARPTNRKGHRDRSSPRTCIYVPTDRRACEIRDQDAIGRRAAAGCACGGDSSRHATKPPSLRARADSGGLADAVGARRHRVGVASAGDRRRPHPGQRHSQRCEHPPSTDLHLTSLCELIGFCNPSQGKVKDYVTIGKTSTASS